MDCLQECLVVAARYRVNDRRWKFERHFLEGQSGLCKAADCLFEVEDFPERDAEIQKPDAAHGATDPARRDNCLYSLDASLARSI